MRNEKIYRWECDADRGSGKDREICNCKGRWTTRDAAIRGGQRHNESHSSHMGHVPSIGNCETVNVVRRTPSGQIKLEIPYDKLNQINRPKPKPAPKPIRMTFESVVRPDEVEEEDGGQAKKFDVVDDDLDHGMFVRLQSWDEDNKHGHADFDALVGRRVRVTVEVVE